MTYLPSPGAHPLTKRPEDSGYEIAKKYTGKPRVGRPTNYKIYYKTALYVN